MKTLKALIRDRGDERGAIREMAIGRGLTHPGRARDGAECERLRPSFPY